VVVVVLLALIWAAVLVPPAIVAHRERQDAFLVSFGAPPAADVVRPRPNALRVQRRRRIAGGLLVAMAATLLVGLLPTFRVFLVVHLFVVDSFLFYVAVLAYQADQAARARRQPRPAVTDVGVERAPRRLRRPVMIPAG
jgi:predicted lipid-binding transport protein (Tim44 family)